MNIYDIRRYGTFAFMVAVGAVVAVFLYFSNSLVRDLAVQERARMQIWADATREIVNVTAMPGHDGSDHIDFLLSIIIANTNIPVLITDDGGNIVDHRNFQLPEPIDSLNPQYISAANEAYLRGKLEQLSHTSNVIHISIEPGVNQHIFYEDSTLLRNLSLYPYIQLIVMLAFVAVVYFAVSSSKRAEQNKVWVGLSKETAHQLGTPISSLMAWIELMRATDIDPEMVTEMDKDVKRLSTIASRFSKIGSKPQMEPTDLNEVVSHSAEYMATRISSRVSLTVTEATEPLVVNMSEPLVEWVMENLIKNAVDAMEAQGAIDITMSRSGGFAEVLVKDTGKGMSRKMRKNVFRPGFTTKKRGWGLGLTLAKRIIEQYHGGSISVVASEPGQGTTFRIQLPLSA
ncbi:MAG: HAMP domain-containing histidine kinase [Firmicutes bacterium]|nr:HAMP domain-containing histidine kinase [Bacillota bacterium]MCM1401507.1 HAMP domain-containing histidine kinase [Bacteroides sp.]MCM1477357.1 HAMP domain-containing histidine kinase [Bacteroides sp.]